ncbi:hypothetical protein C7382_11421 [Porphyromonas loveana]|uniref:Uncharacterized protein n=1 Tax=Porphyromonas loveana TaxID=1884669 RepID=A0A2U1F822_9PORP|nr:hypothetical protein C7382_11421 [Porphyromonas loveana]
MKAMMNNKHLYMADRSPLRLSPPPFDSTVARHQRLSECLYLLFL